MFVNPPVTEENCTWTGVWKTTDDTAPLDMGEEAASTVLSSPFPRRDFLELRLETKETSIRRVLRDYDIAHVARSVFAYTRIRRVKLKSGYSKHSEFAYAFQHRNPRPGTKKSRAEPRTG